jgi:phenylacetate-CoA ligase
MVEACGNLSKCEEGNFHLDHEFCILETVDDGISGRQERMVFTGLCNPAMPLIRYDIGDYCTSEDIPCPCGRHSRVIGSIEGRVEDFIRTPDGRKAVGMNQVFEWADGAREIQVVQQSLDSITVRIVPDEEYGEHTKEALRTEFRKRLGTEVKIDFRQVESIPRSESGKYRAVISEVEPETEEEQALRDAMGTLEVQTGNDG